MSKTYKKKKTLTEVTIMVISVCFKMAVSVILLVNIRCLQCGNIK